MSGPTVVVCERDMRIGDVLPRLGEGAATALAEGRVFVGVNRATSAEQLVRRGDEVLAYEARSSHGVLARILLHQGGLVAAYKPAAMATIADHRGRAGTLAAEVARLTGVPFEQLHATSRLDVGVSGVVLFAADERTRAQLGHARERGAYLRHYVAVATRAPSPSAGTWDAPIGRDRDPRKRRAGVVGAAPALTSYATVAESERAALLAVEPVTGRTHQIRVHAAHASCALWGDATYGGPTRLVSARGTVQALTRIALHAAWVEVALGREHIRVDAPVPDELADMWAALGGAAGAWQGAIAGLDPPGHEPRP